MSLNILLISYSFYPTLGGVESNSVILANEFQNAGHKVRLITWTKDEGKKKFPYQVIRKPNFLEIIKLHLWANVVLENNFSLKLSWPVYITRKAHLLVLNGLIGSTYNPYTFRDKVKVRLIKSISHVVAVSHMIKDEIAPNALVIGNPFDAKIFKIYPNWIRNYDFVFLGRLITEKGADLAIEAIARLQKELNKKFNLNIIGNGPEMSRLVSLVDQYQLNESVHFSGYLAGENLAKVLNECNYILVPSVYQEGFGNVALEGMACGCIPIVADGSGLVDAIGEAGLVFKRGQLDSLLDQIKYLISNPNLQRELRSKAINHLENHHPDNVAAKYLEIISSAVKNVNS